MDCGIQITKHANFCYFVLKFRGVLYKMQKSTGQHCYMIIKELGGSFGYFVFVFAIVS